MTYTLFESGNAVGGDSFESFFLFVRFSVNQQTKMLEIQSKGNYFAFYGSASSNRRSLDLPQFGDEPGSVQTKRYELKGKNDLSLGLNSLALQESRCADLSNEVSHLHLFEFLATGDNGPSTWVDDGGWNATFENRTANDLPQEPFVPHLITFGDCSERDCYWIMSRDTQLGTGRLGAAMPFLKSSILSNILSNAGAACPKLELTVNEQKWSCFDQAPLPGNPTGYVMVCSGAFRQLALSSEVEEWHKLTSGSPAAEEIIDRLSAIVERRGRSEEDRQELLRRTLATAHMTKDSSVVQEDPRHPIELFYVDRKLTKVSERLIQYK
jgi:hypothetical protein